MKTRILLIRHGESLANVKKFIAGRMEVPLSEKGLNQAKLASASLCDLRLDAVFSSPLERAVKTAIPFATARGIPVEVILDFAEWHLGDWEGQPFCELPNKFPKEYYLWDNDPINLHVPNGESARDMRLRVGRALERLADKVRGKTVLVACHGGVIKAIPSYLAGCDDKIFNETGIVGNCSITEVVYENGVPRLVRFADQEHLGKYKSDAFVI